MMLVRFHLECGFGYKFVWLNTDKPLIIQAADWYLELGDYDFGDYTHNEVLIIPTKQRPEW